MHAPSRRPERGRGSVDQHDEALRTSWARSSHDASACTTSFAAAKRLERGARLPAGTSVARNLDRFPRVALRGARHRAAVRGQTDELGRADPHVGSRNSQVVPTRGNPQSCHPTTHGCSSNPPETDRRRGATKDGCGSNDERVSFAGHSSDRLPRIAVCTKRIEVGVCVGGRVVGNALSTRGAATDLE